MFKLSIKPFWIGLFGLLAALVFTIKVALAVAEFVPADAPIGYVAQDDMTSYNLKSGNEVLFRGEYEREFWSGGILAYPIDDKGNLGDPTAFWSAASSGLLDGQDFDTQRLIATMRDDGVKIGFRWNALSATQQTYLVSSTILDFLRGDRSNELPTVGKTLRHRVSAMGDVVHSRPYYVADGSKPTVFVGANDGMLHAIDASGNIPPNVTSSTGGKERWAYVPSMLLPKMKNLSVDPYVHDFYVDGQINIATIASGSKRVLVGGLGGGGKGLYALDITGTAGLIAADESAVANKIMWEITPTKVNYVTPAAPNQNGYVNLGYTYGTVTIAKMLVSGSPKDVVIIGNGYNDGKGLYSNCADASPDYANCGGNYAAYLYVIDAATGQLVKSMKAGSNGTATNPNGLSTPVAVDSDGDGTVDTVYAGDLNGTMWKFILSDSAGTALLVTPPFTGNKAQAITSTPGVAVHPNGGYMVTFGTGKMLVSADAADSTVHYAFGVWDGAPAGNDALVQQTLTERSYTANSVTTRVRRVTANQPDYSAGTGHHKGWQVALPAGERVVGEGSFIENDRFYFTAFNPTITNSIPSTDSKVQGENWQMELDYLTGGVKNIPFLDLSANVKLDDDDRIAYITGDTIPSGSAAGDRILTTDGIPVGKFISIGLLSQPILVQLSTLNNTLYNQNPDIVVPLAPLERGVAGGHFDVELYHGTVAAKPATGKITVTGTGSSNAANLGAITIGGVTVVPALTAADIPNGTDANTMAAKIKAKVTGGFTATVTTNVVTISSPGGTTYNGAQMVVADGNSATATAPTNGSLVITAVAANKTVSIKCGSAFVGSSAAFTSSSNATASGRLDDLFTSINGTSFNGYGVSCTKSGTPANILTCSVSAPPAASACAAGFSVSNITTTTKAGPQGGTTALTNLKPFLTTTTLSGGTLDTFGDSCALGFARCDRKVHEHEYDDIYNRTGVNFLNASNPSYNLIKALQKTTTAFKVLVQNQYLSPAAKIHIGNANYDPKVDAGYVAIKNFQTSAALDIAAVPAYTLDTIGSLTVNLPVDAFSVKDWWGGVNGLPADSRVGLHPVEVNCVMTSASATTDGNMYRPVIPPLGVTDSGNGTYGYNSGTVAKTARGVRHNGALVVQVIRADTPQDALELSMPARPDLGEAARPEYGWRVKAEFYATYVLAEYTMLWHTKHLNTCFGAPGWTKIPAPDLRPCAPKGSHTDTATLRDCEVTPSTKEIGADPLIGELGGNGGTIVSVTVKVDGNVTTTTVVYSNTLTATIVRTSNADGSIKIVTTNTAGEVRTDIIANSAGSVKTGGDERGLQARTGPISWRELVAP